MPTIWAESAFQFVEGVFLVKGSLLYVVIETFFGVALIEEFFKRWAVKRGSWNSREFNYRFDAIVYSVAGALGFATFENLMYVYQHGFAVGVSRALTAVPSHSIDGVIMGYYLGLAKQYELIGDKVRAKHYMKRSLWVPVLVHGMYDCALELNSPMMTLLWLIGVIAIEVYAIRLVKREGKKDAPLFRDHIDW